jgi:hypothetical protein
MLREQSDGRLFGILVVLAQEDMAKLILSLRDSAQKILVFCIKYSYKNTDNTKRRERQTRN